MSTGSVPRCRVSDLLTCPICLEDFEDPRLLPCVHSFCLQCLRGHCKDKCPGDDIPCPVCRTEFCMSENGVDNLPVNFFIKNLTELRDAENKRKQMTICEVCSGDKLTEPATVHCVDCSQNLCDRCSLPHRKWKEGAHDVRPLGELSAELIRRHGSYCNKHAGNRLELYCFDCKANICLTCYAVSHQQHECKEVELVAEEFGASINSIVEPFPVRVSALQEAAQQVESAKQTFLEAVERTQHEIQQRGDELKCLVDDHVRKLTQELNEVKISSEKQVKTRVESYELALTALESFHAYVSELVSKGSPCDITRTANELHVRAEELLKNHVTPRDYLPPQVQFVPRTMKEMARNLVGCLLTSKEETESEERETRAKSIATVFREYLHSSPKVVHTLPIDSDEVCGVTLLNKELYVLRERHVYQMDVYSTSYFGLLRRLSVPGLGTGLKDITSSVHNKCIYISDAGSTCVYRLGSNTAVSKWRLSFSPQSVSVTGCGNVLVTGHDRGLGTNCRLEVLGGTYGRKVRDINLNEITWLWHAITVVKDQFIISHGKEADATVCIVDGQGRTLSKTTAGLALPSHLAVDDTGFVFVSDQRNSRIVLFDPSLKHVCNMMEGQLSPYTVCCDDVIRRLYVAQTGGVVSVVQL